MMKPHVQRCRKRLARATGFTLIEMLLVLVITGIVASMVGVFIVRPIDAYVDVARRAELSDAADLALRRVARELSSALPNSVRVTPSGQYLEYLPVAASGRYRAAPDSNGNGDFLNFDDPTDGSFDILGPSIKVPGAVGVAPAPQLVIYNLGIPGADAYTGETIRPLSVAGAASSLSYNVGGGQFPYPSPGNRFQVVLAPISYVCLPAAGGTGTLRRYTGYTIQSGQPVDIAAAPLSGLTGIKNALLADHVANCSFSYAPGASARIGLVTMRLTLASGGETITFVHQAHVDNSP